MKGFRKYSIPKPVKAISCLLCAVLLVSAAYLLLGAAPVSLESAFRRAERGNLIGPSEILGTFSFTEKGADNVVIAETEESYILFTNEHSVLAYRRFLTYTKPGELYYAYLVSYPKTDSMTLYSIPYHAYYERPLNLILFDQTPSAEKAVIELEVVYSYDGKHYTMPIHCEATREYSEFFLFHLSYTKDATEHWERAAKQLDIYCNQYNLPGTDKPQATVHLYDKHGKLISTQTILPGPIQ